MKIAIIIPAYNEESSISSVINNIRSSMPDSDIIVVNDRSGDSTSVIAEGLGVVVLNHPIHMGYGAALQTGYKYVLDKEYDFIAQIDADGQHDPNYIKEMVSLLKRENYDVVVGSRFKEGSYKTSLLRKTGIVFFRFIVNLLTRKGITDPTSGFKVMRKSLLNYLTSDNFPSDYPDADFLIFLYYQGFRIIEYPVQMRPKGAGKSMHDGLLGNIYYMFKMCLSILLTVIREKISFSKKGKCR